MSTVDIATTDTITTIICSGALDLAIVPELRTAIDRAIGLNRPLHIDLRDVPSIDDCAVGIMLGSADRVRTAGHDFSVSANDGVATRLRRLGVDNLLDLRR